MNGTVCKRCLHRVTAVEYSVKVGATFAPVLEACLLLKELLTRLLDLLHSVAVSAAVIAAHRAAFSAKETCFPLPVR